MQAQFNSGRKEGTGMKKLFGPAFALLLALALVGGGALLRAGSQVTEFDVHVGDALIQSLGLPAGDVAQASNGDTIKVIFTGHIDVEDRDADGKGTFEHRDSSGTLLESGTFRAERLITFTDFGTDAAFPPTFHGGHSVIVGRGVSHPASNPTANTKFNAALTVDCLIGNPPAGLEEGINFGIQGGLNFNTKVSGNTLYVATED